MVCCPAPHGTPTSSLPQGGGTPPALLLPQFPLLHQDPRALTSPLPLPSRAKPGKKVAFRSVLKRGTGRSSCHLELGGKMQAGEGKQDRLSSAATGDNRNNLTNIHWLWPPGETRAWESCAREARVWPCEKCSRMRSERGWVDSFRNSAQSQCGGSS